MGYLTLTRSSVLLGTRGVVVDGYRCWPTRCEGGQSITDRNGAYNLSLYGGDNAIWVTKDGYTVDGPPPHESCEGCNALVTLKGDTRFDLQLVRR